MWNPLDIQTVLEMLGARNVLILSESKAYGPYLRPYLHQDETIGEDIGEDISTGTNKEDGGGGGGGAKGGAVWSKLKPLTEPVYGTRYWAQTIDSAWVHEWSALLLRSGSGSGGGSGGGGGGGSAGGGMGGDAGGGGMGSGLHLPEANVYMPSHFDILTAPDNKSDDGEGRYEGSQPSSSSRDLAAPEMIVGETDPEWTLEKDKTVLW